jgi:hypothetical protein
MTLLDLPKPTACSVGGREVSAGARVRLLPRARGGDVMDIALRGKTATVVSIEQDFEDRVYLTVVVDDDPGADLGRQALPGHRFYFLPEEVELVP